MTGSATPTLVVVEDNASDVYLLEYTLKELRLDCNLVVYRDVPEALHSLEQQTPPMGVILDLNLPSGDGFQLLSFIRESEPIKDVPIAVVTSSESPIDKERCQAMGATYYLHKPTDLDEFVTIIGHVMRSILHGSPT